MDASLLSNNSMDSPCQFELSGGHDPDELLIPWQETEKECSLKRRRNSYILWTSVTIVLGSCIGVVALLLAFRALTREPLLLGEQQGLVPNCNGTRNICFHITSNKFP